MTMLMERVGLLEPLRAAIAAACRRWLLRRMIVLAREVTDGMAEQRGLGLLDISVRRNGYGARSTASKLPSMCRPRRQAVPRSVHQVAARESAGSAEVVATHDGRPVAVRQGHILALCFHPELTGDRRLHQEFVRMAT